MNLLFVDRGIQIWWGKELFPLSFFCKHGNLFFFIYCEVDLLRWREKLILGMVVLTRRLLFFRCLYHCLHKAVFAFVFRNTMWYWLVKCRDFRRQHMVSFYANTFFVFKQHHKLIRRDLLGLNKWTISLSFRLEVIWYISWKFKLIWNVTNWILTQWRPRRA